MSRNVLLEGGRHVALIGNVVPPSLVSSTLTVASVDDCRALGRSVASHWLACTPLPLIDTV